MNQHFQSVILNATQAKGIFDIEAIQNLWSGYGKIVRYGLKDSAIKSVVVKHIHPPSKNNHPRGWNTDLSHQRKLKSYQVETAWYTNWNKYCSDACKTPGCLGIESNNDEIIIILQDLNQTGFPKLKPDASLENMKTCLSWLANFHATFLNKQPLDLWTIGTYWHLDTRPEELQCLKDSDLKNAAKLIFDVLSKSSLIS